MHQLSDVTGGWVAVPCGPNGRTGSVETPSAFGAATCGAMPGSWDLSAIVGSFTGPAIRRPNLQSHSDLEVP
jgi:hypothetical protein